MAVFLAPPALAFSLGDFFARITRGVQRVFQLGPTPIGIQEKANDAKEAVTSAVTDTVTTVKDAGVEAARSAWAASLGFSESAVEFLLDPLAFIYTSIASAVLGAARVVATGIRNASGTVAGGIRAAYSWVGAGFARAGDVLRESATTTLGFLVDAITYLNDGIATTAPALGPAAPIATAVFVVTISAAVGFAGWATWKAGWWLVARLQERF